MVKLLLFCLVFTLCWPLALLALALAPILWLMSLPFRLVGLVLHGVFSLAWTAFVLWFVWMVVTLPFRWLSAGRTAEARIL